MNLETLLQNAGGEIGFDDLRALNMALRKAADIGYQTPAATSGAGIGSLSPLVPQSIEGVLSSQTFEETDIVLWKRIAKVNASQTVHEYPVVTSRGKNTSPFVAEGSPGVNGGSNYKRGSVKIKFMLERREVTDVATMTGLIGVNPQALANETEQGTLALMEKVERALLHADSSIEDLAFDGLIKQIKDGGNVTDKLGGTTTMDEIEWHLGEMGSAPYFARPDCVYVEPKVYRDLSRQGNVTIRTGADGVSRVYGVPEGGLFAHGPYGKVPIVAVPFLYTAEKPDAAASASDAPATPAIASGPAHDAGLGGTSKWTSSNAGDYKWKIVAVGAKGYSAPVTSNAMGVVAGDKVKITINNTPSDVLFYRIYRSDKAASGASDDTTCKYVFSVKANNGGTTTIADYGAVWGNTTNILFVKHSPDIMEFVRLLDFIRRPIPSLNLSTVFALLLFGSPVVKVPQKCWIMTNVAYNAAS